MKINPNECNKGKAYKLAFKTGAHKDKKKEAQKYSCRGEKNTKRLD